MKKIIKLCCLPMLLFALCFVLTDVAEAKVRVNINGYSNGETLSKSKGPAKRGRTIRVQDRGGSITQAKARAVYNKRQVIIGNKVKATHTDGDPEATSVQAGSIFAGTATFYAKNKGTVDNYTINTKFKGTLKCNSPEPSLPEGYAYAAAQTEFRKNGTTLYSGSATYDAISGLTESGQWSGDFNAGSNSSSINKREIINLGTLTHKQKISLYFSGSTSVYFDVDVPIDNCVANFYGTDSIKENKESKKLGRIVFKPAKNGTLIFDPESFDINSALADSESTDTVSVYIESKNKKVLKKLKKSTIRLHADFTEDGYVEAGSVLKLSDVDGDGINERGFTVNAYDLATLLSNAVPSGETSIKMHATAETTKKSVITAAGTLNLE